MKQIGSRGISFTIASAALAYLCWMYVVGAPRTHGNLVETQRLGVLKTDPALITNVEITGGELNLAFAKQDNQWRVVGARQGLAKNWRSALVQAVQFMHTAGPVRILSPEATAGIDAAAYGLNPAQLTVRLTGTDGTELTVLFGHIGNDGILQYMKIEGTPQTYLMSGFVGAQWYKMLVPNISPVENQHEDYDVDRR